jgi:hypothetical protein
LPNYAPIVRREAKKARRKRQRDEAFAKQAVAVEDDVSGGDAVEEAERAVVLAPQPRAAQEEQRHTHDRYENELCDAFADEEDQGEEPGVLTGVFCLPFLVGAWWREEANEFSVRCRKIHEKWGGWSRWLHGV